VTTPTATPPTLLKEAVYTHFRSPRWTAPRREFQPVFPSADLVTWRFSRSTRPRRSVTITRYAAHNQAILALPNGTLELHNLPATSIETNLVTTARARGTPPLLSYAAFYDERAGDESLPMNDDLDLDHLRPEDLRAISRAAFELGIRPDQKTEAVQHIREFLLTKFEYSLEPPRGSPVPTNASALGDFLFESRRGHCEFFATATVLLLRAASIPARYAVGYSVQEKRGNQFVVRARHAHAWAMAYLDGAWRPIDNTPGGWVQREAALASLWSPVSDWFSQVWLEFTRWRMGESRWRAVVFCIGMALLAGMAWRELRGGRWQRWRNDRKAKEVTRAWPGTDSEFYQVEKRLHRRGALRSPGEPYFPWLRRQNLDQGQAGELLQKLVILHYRLRFRPGGLSHAERDELRAGVTTYLKQR
jgi:transglutaminase-like putative cysteine protease